MTDPENLGRAESFAICPAIWADRHGYFYVGEVFKAKRIQKFVHTGQRVVVQFEWWRRKAKKDFSSFDVLWTW